METVQKMVFDANDGSAGFSSGGSADRTGIGFQVDKYEEYRRKRSYSYHSRWG